MNKIDVHWSGEMFLLRFLCRMLHKNFMQLVTFKCRGEPGEDRLMAKICECVKISKQRFFFIWYWEVLRMCLDCLDRYMCQNETSCIKFCNKQSYYRILNLHKALLFFDLASLIWLAATSCYVDVVSSRSNGYVPANGIRYLTKLITVGPRVDWSTVAGAAWSSRNRESYWSLPWEPSTNLMLPLTGFNG